MMKKMNRNIGNDSVNKTIFEEPRSKMALASNQEKEII